MFFCACNTFIVLTLLFFSSAYYIFYIVSRNIVSQYYIRRPCSPTLSGHPSSSFPCIFLCFSLYILYPGSSSTPSSFFVTHHLSHTTFLPHSIFHTQLVTRHRLHASFLVNHHLFHTQLCHAPYIYICLFCQPPFFTHRLFFTRQAWHTCGDMTKQMWFFFCLTPSGMVFFPTLWVLFFIIRFFETLFCHLC